MEYTSTKVGFRPERHVRKGYEDRIQFPLNGRAPKGLWNHKLEFMAEVVCEHPHTVVKFTNYVELPYFRREKQMAKLEEAQVRRRAFNFAGINKESHLNLPQTVLWGEDVSLSVLRGAQSGLVRFRHVDTHVLCFVHHGSGLVLTDFGFLHFRDDDFIMLPRGTTYSIHSDRDVCILVYEFAKRIMSPKHYWMDGYPFSLSSVIPASPSYKSDLPGDGGLWPVFAKRHAGVWSLLQYPFSPFDAVAWEGELYPFVLHLEDIRTIASPDFHIDPTALTVFVTEDESASIQVFKPRWAHSLPYPHRPYVTEVLFNHKGYSARPDVKDGFATVHPPGTFHGPDVRMLDKQRTQGEVMKKDLPWRDEVAVMLETCSPLVVSPVAESVEVKEYEWSWDQQYQELQEKEAGAKE